MPEPSAIPMDVDKESPGIGIGSACVGESDRSLAIPPKTYLVTLPRELVLEIINHCVKTGEHTLQKKRDVIQLSLVTKALRELCVPLIFTTMQLHTSYPNLLSKILDINNDRLLHVVQHLEIRRGWVPETSAGLAKLLSYMPNVSDLCLSLTHDYKFGISLQRQLLEQGVVLPAIKKVQYRSSSSRSSILFLPEVFTGLDSLHLDLRYEVSLSTVFGMSEAPSSLKLRAISLQKEGWVLEDVSEIYSFFPEVTKLILGRTINYNLKLSEFFPILKRFRGLTLLALTDLIDPPESLVSDIQALKQGFCEFLHDDEDHEPGCILPRRLCHANHYLEAWEDIQDEHALKEDQGEHSDELFRICPSLESIYFLDSSGTQAHRFTPVKGISGNLDSVREESWVRWPTISEYVGF
ncbi:hypothetical protein COL154_007071 [Colletotrichum chrysophilum]|nr:hypothetical protein COL154_007071 [Colletotrichum chrysophilum]